jgi:hypothetical protein
VNINLAPGRPRFTEEHRMFLKTLDLLFAENVITLSFLGKLIQVTIVRGWVHKEKGWGIAGRSSVPLAESP